MFKRSVLPVLTVLGVIMALWYAACIPMNSAWTIQQLERSGETMTVSEHIADTWAQERPRLPAPHQVAAELWDTTVMKKITSKKSLIYHGWITLSATLLGFGIGTTLEIGRAHV